MGPLFSCSVIAVSLEDPPHKMGQQCEEQQHKPPANPDQEVEGQLRGVDLFFVHEPHATTLSRRRLSQIHCLHL